MPYSESDSAYDTIVAVVARWLQRLRTDQPSLADVEEELRAPKEDGTTRDQECLALARLPVELSIDTLHSLAAERAELVELLLKVKEAIEKNEQQTNASYERFVEVARWWASTADAIKGRAYRAIREEWKAGRHCGTTKDVCYQCTGQVHHEARENIAYTLGDSIGRTVREKKEDEERARRMAQLCADEEDLRRELAVGPTLYVNATPDGYFVGIQRPLTAAQARYVVTALQNANVPGSRNASAPAADTPSPQAG